MVVCCAYKAALTGKFLTSIAYDSNINTRFLIATVKMPPKSATKKISNLAKTATKKAPKPPAPKQAAKKAAKQAPRPVKRAASSAKSAASRATKGTGKTKGWVGGQGGASTDLSKWFGELLFHSVLV